MKFNEFQRSETLEYNISYHAQFLNEFDIYQNDHENSNI
jgi:hypothetical protein